jgi:hypothetical protein
MKKTWCMTLTGAVGLATLLSTGHADAVTPASTSTTTQGYSYLEASATNGDYVWAICFASGGTSSMGTEDESSWVKGSFQGTARIYCSDGYPQYYHNYGTTWDSWSASISCPPGTTPVSYSYELWSN